MARVTTYHFKVILQEVNRPKVMRKVSVPANFTFAKFHKVLQVVFGFNDYHLFEFSDKTDMLSNLTFRITIPSEWDGEYAEPTIDARKAKLSSFFKTSDKITYEYDYGDAWMFDIKLEKTTLEEYPYACCTGGTGTPPPEDCGGTGGFEAMKHAFKTGGEDAESYREWLGMGKKDKWTPDYFSFQMLRYINAGLMYIR